MTLTTNVTFNWEMLWTSFPSPNLQSILFSILWCRGKLVLYIYYIVSTIDIITVYTPIFLFRKFRSIFCRIFFSRLREVWTSCRMFGRPVPAASDENNEASVAATNTTAPSNPPREQHQRYATST